MQIDRDRYREGLAKISKAPGDVLDHIMDKTEPFLLYADAGLYKFSPANQIKKRAVSAAVETALGSKVRKVELISVSEPWNDWPSWASEEDIKTLLHHVLRNGMMQKLWFKVRDIYGEPLRKSTSSCRINHFEIQNLVTDTLEQKLWKSLKVCVEATHLWHDDLWRELSNCIHFALEHYTSFRLSGNDQEADKLEGLIDVMPMTIPLGAQKFHKGTQFSFVA